MQKNDDQLVKEFMATGKQEIADHGFSQRVMRNLPTQPSLLARFWTGTCFILTAVLFFMLNGVEILVQSIYELGESFLAQEVGTETDIQSLAIAGMVLLYLAYKKIASLA